MTTMVRLCLFVSTMLSVFELGYMAPAFGDAFPIGMEDMYDFENVVHMGNTQNASYQFGYHIHATVIVAAVWGNDETKLLRIQIQNPSIINLPDEKGGLIDGVKTSYYALWNLGRINHVYFPSTDSVPVRSFKKGIAALFQYQLLDGTYDEEDPSGHCTATYTSHSSTRYHKSKANCRYEAKRNQRLEYALRSSLKTSRTTDFSVSTEGALQKIRSQDYMKYLLNAYDNFGTYYNSMMGMNVQGSSRKTDTITGPSVADVIKRLSLETETLLTTDYRRPCENTKCENIIGLFKAHKQMLTNENVGKASSSTSLIELIHMAREATKEDLARIIKAKSSSEFKGQILDLLGAVQTKAAHEAAWSEVGNDSGDADRFLAERYLQALAIGTRPQEEILQSLLKIAAKESQDIKYVDSLVQCLASVSRRYAQLEGKSYETEVVKQVTDFLIKQFNACTNDACKVTYIRGLHNLQCPTTADMLLNLAQEGTRIVSVAAMKALRSFSAYLWNEEFRAKFEDIFYQVSKRYDSSTRTLALDILLDMKPDHNELSHIVQFLKSNDKAYEVKQYLLQKLRMFAEQCSDFATVLRKVIASDPTLNNYDVLGPRGLSTALRRTFSTAPSFNASLTSLQEMHGGVLKRGIVDLSLDVNDEKTSLFTLGLYAGGMSSFVSSNDEEGNDGADEEETTAGMELSVQGTVMRPLEFFSGKGELMGHVWSGTASEPTPAYQAITLLQDNEESFASHNGAVIKVSATGAISIDLNGQVTMSLWGRNAQSKVEQNIGINMMGQLSLATPFVAIDVKFNAIQEPKLHLTSALDFSGDPALCMQLLQPKSTLEQHFATTVSLLGTDHKIVRKTKKLFKLNGLTHSLNRKNNEMCNLITKS